MWNAVLRFSLAKSQLAINFCCNNIKKWILLWSSIEKTKALTAVCNVWGEVYKLSIANNCKGSNSSLTVQTWVIENWKLKLVLTWMLNLYWLATILLDAQRCCACSRRRKVITNFTRLRCLQAIIRSNLLRYAHWWNSALTLCEWKIRFCLDLKSTTQVWIHIWYCYHG